MIEKIRIKIFNNGMCKEDEFRTSQYDISLEGEVSYRLYKSQTKEIIEEKIYIEDKELIQEIFENLREYIESGKRDDDIFRICDGSSYNLRAYYSEGYIKEFRGSRCGGSTVDKIIDKFIKED